MQIDYRNLGLQMPPMSPTPGGLPTMQDRMLPQARQAPPSITPGRTIGPNGAPMRPDPIGNWNPFATTGMPGRPDPLAGWNPFPNGLPQAQVQNEPGNPWGQPQAQIQNEPGGNPWGQPLPQTQNEPGGGPGMPQGGFNYGPNIMQMIMQMRNGSMP